MLNDLPVITPELRDRLLSTLVLIAALVAIRVIASRTVRARIGDATAQYRLVRSVNYALVAVGFLLIGRLWVSGIGQLGTFLGLLSAGLALALREPITNMAGFLLLLWRRPFRVGDRIQINDIAGDVVDMRLFQFSLLEIRGRFSADQPTGRIVHIPNATIFNTPQFNASDGFPYLWSELPVVVTFESNWEKAKQAFIEIAERHAIHTTEFQRSMRVRYTMGPIDADANVFTSVNDDGVVLTIRALTPVRGARKVSQAIWEDVLRQVAQWDDVDFAYPTTRIYNNRREGKPDARAP